MYIIHRISLNIEIRKEINKKNMWDKVFKN